MFRDSTVCLFRMYNSYGLSLGLKSFVRRGDLVVFDKLDEEIMGVHYWVLDI